MRALRIVYEAFLVLSRVKDSKRDPTTTRTNMVDEILVRSVVLRSRVSNSSQSHTVAKKLARSMFETSALGNVLPILQDEKTRRLIYERIKGA